MATRKIVNKHINQSSSTYVGVDGELFYDTVTNTLKISDGTTAGGTQLATNLVNYANGTARDAAIPTPSLGMLVFNVGTNKVEVWTGAQWSVLGP